MIKKIIESFARPMNYFVLLMAEILVTVFFYGIAFFIFKFLGIDLSILADKNRFFSTVFFVLYFICIYLVANYFNKDKNV